jgi:hypothetical protein
MGRASRNLQLLSDLRMTSLACDLELHLALQHHNELVGRAPKGFPALSRQIGPEVAGEGTCGPFGGDLPATWFSSHCRSPS